MRGADAEFRVLIVEPDELSQKLLRVLFGSEAYEHLGIASTAGEALQFIEASPPDLIVLELSLPDVDGLELARRLKRDALTSRIPILATSVRPRRGLRQEALTAGCDEYFVKPIDSNALLECASRYLGSSPSGGEAR